MRCRFEKTKCDEHGKVINKYEIMCFLQDEHHCHSYICTQRKTKSFILVGRSKYKFEYFVADSYYSRLHNFYLWNPYKSKIMISYWFLLNIVSKEGHFRKCDKIFSFVSLQTHLCEMKILPNYWQWGVCTKTELHSQAERQRFSIDLVYLIQ